MSFASLPFLFLFLPGFFLVYYTALACRFNISGLNFIALLASILFYTWGAPRFVPALLLSCVVDYLLSRKISASADSDPRRKALFCSSILLNVGGLLYFKYANFFIAQANSMLSEFGMSAFAWTPVLLPIGISFITFEKLSYQIDVYRRTTSPAPNFTTYLLFIALFPHLIAGPIFRYHDLAEQLLRRKHSLEKTTSGAFRFIVGLSKKVLIADVMAAVADQIFALPQTELSCGRAWLGIIAYAYQIYFDFSGYSDMAIGLGRMMGFQFIENFNHPYISQSITEFWRRWHITLSNWLREYLYFPLGGNRISPLRTYFNLWIVFLVSGFWHGANWTFLVWGSYHGLFLMLDRLFLLRLSEKLPAPARCLLTFALVLIGWVFFRADSIGQAIGYIRQMFVPSDVSPVPNLQLLYTLNARTHFVFVVATLLSFVPLSRLMFDRLHMPFSPDAGRLRFACCSAGALMLFFLSAAALTNSNFHPFIYFRF